MINGGNGRDDEHETPAPPRSKRSAAAHTIADLGLSLGALGIQCGEIARTFDASGGTARSALLWQLAQELRDAGGVCHDAARHLEDIAQGRP